MIPHIPPCSMHTAGLLKVGLAVRDTSVPLRAAALQLLDVFTRPLVLQL